jgi:glycylpeptide N-tetradecanoyltransferase
MIKLYRLPHETNIPGLRPMEEKDVPEANKLLMGYLEQFDLHVTMKDDEFKHWLLPRENVITTYVVEDPKSKKITDLFSFYTLCSSIIGHDKYKTLRAAYSFYNVPGSASLKDLVQDALIVANRDDFDVFNCLDVMDNVTIMKDLKFGIGDGNLQYYLYNWYCPEMPAEKVGLVLL